MSARVRFWKDGNEWTATLDGKSADILRIIPGMKAYPARWNSKEEALAELRQWFGCDIVDVTS